LLFSLVYSTISVFGPRATSHAAGQANPRAEPPGPGVAFSGSTSYAKVDDPRVLDLDAFTVAVWAKPQTHRFSQVLLNRGEAGKLFTFYLHEGRVRMLVEYSPGRYTHANCPEPPAGVWTHLAGSYNGREIKVYLNGQLQHTVEASGRITESSALLFIGTLAPDSRPFHGRLEDIRVWSRSLAETEIALVAAGKQTAALNRDLVAHWTSHNLHGPKWRAQGSPGLVAHYSPDGALEVRKANGYRGIWYQCGEQGGPYRYKYSGGLGTYCAKHRPLAVYAREVNKTFFCYGGTDAQNSTLLHMVSYYDHTTGTVPRPTVLLDKRTTDAHDNPVLSIDAKGHLWIFSSAHGTARPAYVSVSKRPYDIDDFERVLVTNFSYPQPYYTPDMGFLLLHTRYGDGRRLYQMSSREGRTWSEPTLLAAIGWGHYQVSGRRDRKIGTAFNYHRPHPKDGSHWRTNLYYMETDDFGQSWRTAASEPLDLPLADPRNTALVHDFEQEQLDVYVKDVALDASHQPVILYLTSRGNEAGPKNDPRTWRIARWTGDAWENHDVLVSNNNYDTGSLYIESPSLWRLIGPTEPGPQRYNSGGEVAMWTSTDHGSSWNRLRQLTRDSQYNHTYCRRPTDAHPEFYAFWADGHGLEPSPSRLYFTDREGTHVWRLPETMDGETARPEVAW
jgi:hypothetical protein